MTIKQTEEKGSKPRGVSLYCTRIIENTCSLTSAIGLIRSTLATDNGACPRTGMKESCIGYMKICHLSVNRKAIKNSHNTGCGNSNRNFFNKRVAWILYGFVYSKKLGERSEPRFCPFFSNRAKLNTGVPANSQTC